MLQTETNQQTAPAFTAPRGISTYALPPQPVRRRNRMQFGVPPKQSPPATLSITSDNGSSVKWSALILNDLHKT
jgi:hypothetical protein